MASNQGPQSILKVVFLGGLVSMMLILSSCAGCVGLMWIFGPKEEPAAEKPADDKNAQPVGGVDLESLNFEKKYIPSANHKWFLEGAHQAAADPKCSHVTDGGPSSTKGSKKDPWFFYTCQPNKDDTLATFNVFLPLSQIKKHQGKRAAGAVKPPVPLIDLAMRCKDVVSDRLTRMNYPVAVEEKSFSSKLYNSPNGTGHYLYRFRVPLASGVKLNYRALCEQDVYGKFSISVSPDSAD